MTSPSDCLPEVIALVNQLCNGELTTTGMARLDQHLAESDTALQYYIECLDSESQLLCEPIGTPATMATEMALLMATEMDSSTAPPAESDQSVLVRSTIPSFLNNPIHGVIGYFSQEVPFSFLVATVVTGLGLLIGSLIHVSRPEQIEQIAENLLPPTPSVVEPAMEIVGRITGMVDCKWSKDSRAPYGYDNVMVGRQYKLESGLMQITYDTGAKVILQGPVTYEAESNGGYLSLGKLTGKLEKKKEHLASSNPQSPIPNPFVIRTPTAVVTDLGTEFGVEVRPDHREDVVVMQGQVRVAIRSGQNADGQTQTLHAGQTARIDCQSSTLIIGTMPADNMRVAFVRKLPSRHMPARLERGLVAYWSFDDAANLGKNATGGGDLASVDSASHETAGLIGNALRLHRDAKNDTLLFNGGQGVPKGIPTGDSSYSISAWYRVDTIKLNGIFDIVGWGEATLGRANALILYGNSPKQCMVRNFWWDNDCAGFVDMASATGGWHHVVSTYDRRGRMQYLYLDKERIGLRAVEDRPDFGSNNFAVGRRHKRLEPNCPLEWVDGLLDEIGIWNRELSEPEISRLYNNGKGLNPLAREASAAENAATQPASEGEKGGKTASTGN